MRTLKTFGQALDYVQALPWGTAAGTSRDARMILKYAQAGAKIVTHGSNTKLPRAGDPRNFYYDPETAWSINALRIPNRSLEKYIPELKTLKKEVNACGSELWVSFSAGDKFIPEEYEAANRVLFAEEAADVTDNNASCPNLEVDGKLKQSDCFDPVAYEEYAAACRAGAGTNKISFKWAPVTDSGLQEKLIEKGKPYKPDYIDIANTVAGGYLELRGGKPAIPGVRMSAGRPPCCDACNIPIVVEGYFRNLHRIAPVGVSFSLYRAEAYQNRGKKKAAPDWTPLDAFVHGL